ncbi:sugar ABC transporter substrate-binding protein [Agromyces sp. NPDC056965]|uniref:sugar ABC transporter substrate-binding protein n=1 Tax=Agromyces sp. NPDC056965 TaxID=3345983 RepID=UPI0036346B76
MHITPITSTNRRSRRGRALVTAGAIGAAVILLSACSGGATADPSASPGASDGSGSDLEAAVAALLEPRDEYPVPTEPTGDVASLAGTTVYYVPLTQQSPQFNVTGEAVTEAFAAVDVDVQICNGNATPTEIDSCITQATQADAAAIITDAIPYGMASNALDAAQAAGIPVVLNNNYEMPEHPASETLQYGPDAAVDQLVGLFQWIALDSGGTGKVLFNEATDGSAALTAEEALEQANGVLPDGEIIVNEISSSNFPLIPSSTSSALLQHPEIGYVFPQFANHLQPTQGGVEQAGRLADTKGAVSAAQLGALQQLEADNFLYAAAGQASVFQGWVAADIAMRMQLGTELPEYEIPFRLFTRDTIGDVELSAEAEASGEWFGPATFRDDFLAIWGAE